MQPWHIRLNWIVSFLHVAPLFIIEIIFYYDILIFLENFIAKKHLSWTGGS